MLNPVLCCEHECVPVCGVWAMADVSYLPVERFVSPVGCETASCADFGYGSGYYEKATIGGDELKPGAVSVDSFEVWWSVCVVGRCTAVSYVYSGSGTGEAVIPCDSYVRSVVSVEDPVDAICTNTGGGSGAFHCDDDVVSDSGVSGVVSVEAKCYHL